MTLTMAGQRHTHGCFWRWEAYSIYNLNGQYTKISGKMGHVDGSNTGDSILSIFTDGKLYRQIELSASMIPQDITIDVTGVLQLRIETSPVGVVSPTYGFANVIIE
jgi:hypothetical protein